MDARMEIYVNEKIQDFEPFLDLSAVVISALLLLATIIGSFAAAASFRAAQQNNQTAKLAILTELANEWLRVQGNWNLAQAIVRGIDDYYSPVLAHQEELILRAHNRYQEEPFEKNLHLNRIRNDIEVLVQYFDRLSIKILEGVLDPADVYSVLGPTVARHSRVVRWTVGAAIATPGLNGLPSREPDYDWARYPVSKELRGRRSRVIYLSDALWSELVQRRDLQAHNISGAAIHKHSSGSGLLAQKRAFELARVFGTRVHALRLSNHLTFAEYIPKKVFLEFGSSSVESDDRADEELQEMYDAKLARTLIRRMQLLKYRFFAP